MDLLQNPTTKLRDDEKLIIEELLSLSPTEHVNAISAGLAERQNLCSVCTAATDQISDFIFSFDRPLEERPKPDPLWPLEHNLNSLRAVFDGFRVLPPETVGVHADDKLPPDIVLHHREAKTILNSARHCALCQLIKVAIVMDTSRKRGFPYDSPKSRLQHVFGLLRGEEHGFMLHSALLELWHSKDPIFLHLSDINKFGQDSKDFNKFTLDSIRIVWQRPQEAHQDDRRNVVYTMLNTFLPTACNEDVKPYIAGRPPIRSSASLQSFDIIRTWMQQCKEGHSWCMKSIGRDILDPSEFFELPTRLIDTGQPGSTSEPRLIDTKGYPAGQWVALSHCWGEPKNHPLMTTTKNIQDHMKCISFSSLPKTFVDAIIVTRALGLRYLWIDSLCIIQDSEEDWLAESKDMGLIYEQAVLTIAATGAKDSTKGLFLPRDYGCLPILSVPVPLIRKQADGGRPCIIGKYNIAIEWRQEPFIQPMHPSFSPLAARGWATQEWILSRRTVHFLPDGMSWVCRTKQEDESGRMILGHRLSEPEWCTEWGRIISDHSLRSFTYIKDRLISLEGLARSIVKTKGYTRIDLKTLQIAPWVGNQDYWFGTWVNDMPEHLLWSPVFVDNKLVEFPTWSWASHSGPVWFRFLEFDKKREDFEFHTNCSIIGCDTDSGALSIRAKKYRIDTFLKRRMEESYTSYREVKTVDYRAANQPGYHIERAENEPHGWAVFDDGKELGGTETLYFLDLATATYYTEPQSVQWGLLLVESKNGIFERTGLATIWDRQWMEEATEAEVVIT